MAFISCFVFLNTSIESLCSLCTCLCLNRSCFVLLNHSSSTRLTRCYKSCLWQPSKYSYFLRTGPCKLLFSLPTEFLLLMFHSHTLWSISTFSDRFQFGFSFAAFCTIRSTLNEMQSKYRVKHVL